MNTMNDCMTSSIPPTCTSTTITTNAHDSHHDNTLQPTHTMCNSTNISIAQLYQHGEWRRKIIARCHLILALLASPTLPPVSAQAEAASPQSPPSPQSSFSIQPNDTSASNNHESVVAVADAVSSSLSSSSLPFSCLSSSKSSYFTRKRKKLGNTVDDDKNKCSKRTKSEMISYDQNNLAWWCSSSSTVSDDSTINSSMNHIVDHHYTQQGHHPVEHNITNNTDASELCQQEFLHFSNALSMTGLFVANKIPSRCCVSTVNQLHFLRTIMKLNFVEALGAGQSVERLASQRKINVQRQARVAARLLQSSHKFGVIGFTSSDQFACDLSIICSAQEECNLPQWLDGTGDARPFCAANAHKHLQREVPSSCWPLVRNDDYLHVPFSHSEWRVIIRFQRANATMLSNLLPGRSLSDIERFLASPRRKQRIGIRILVSASISSCSDTEVLNSDLNQSSSLILPSSIVADTNNMKADTNSMQKQLEFNLLNNAKSLNCTRLLLSRELHPSDIRHRVARIRYRRSQVRKIFSLCETVEDVNCGSIRNVNEHMCVAALTLDSGRGYLSHGTDGDAQHKGRVVIVDTTSMHMKSLPDFKGTVNEIAWTSDGKEIVVGTGDGTAAFFDLNGQTRSFFPEKCSSVVSMASHSSCARRLVAVARDQVDVMWFYTQSNVSDNQPYMQQTLPLGSSRRVHDMQFGDAATSSDNVLLAGYMSDASFDIIRLRTSSVYRSRNVSVGSTLLRGSVLIVRSCPMACVLHGSFALGVSSKANANEYSDEIHTFDPRQRNTIRHCLRTSTCGFRRFINDMRVSPNGMYLHSCASDGGVSVHDMRCLDSPPIFELEHRAGIEMETEGVVAEWTPDSSFLCTGGDDCAVRIWDCRLAANDAQVQCIKRNGHGVVCALSTSRQAPTSLVSGDKLGQLIIMGDLVTDQ